MKLAARERDGHRCLVEFLPVGGAHRTVCSLLPGRLGAIDSSRKILGQNHDQ